MINEELRQRLAKEYRYAVEKMQDSPQPSKKLFYFSIYFGEPQRIINLEWDRSLALISIVSQYVFTSLTALINPPALGTHPIDHEVVFMALVHAASDLAVYFENKEDNTEELHQILGRLTEIGYAATGNGSYLHEKGLIKL